MCGVYYFNLVELDYCHECKQRCLLNSSFLAAYASVYFLATHSSQVNKYVTVLLVADDRKNKYCCVRQEAGMRKLVT